MVYDKLLCSPWNLQSVNDMGEHAIIQSKRQFLTFFFFRIISVPIVCDYTVQKTVSNIFFF